MDKSAYTPTQPATAYGKMTRLAFLLDQAGSLAKEINRLRRELGPVISRLERPKQIPKDQAWFWTDEWQAGEREVDEAIARGEVETFDNVEDLIADLHRHVETEEN